MLLEDGFNPVVFCRFIPTAEYVAEGLKKEINGVEIACVTRVLPSDEREARVLSLAEAQRRILVCTDCLSEGINLQEIFDAVVHYDLSWNPTRHEQREGRVDRFGQPRDEVRVVTMYGVDNQIDGIILDVLIRKHKTIRSSLGISVPVPVDTNQVIETIFEGLLLREQQAGRTPQKQLELFEEYLRPQKKDLFQKWEDATEKEKRSRTLFAQRTIKPEEVAEELHSQRETMGSAKTVEEFMLDAIAAFGGAVEKKEKGIYAFQLDGTPQALRDAIGVQSRFNGAFQLPVPPDVHYLHRTHPIVEGLSSFVMDMALDPKCESPARRSGVIRTKRMEKRTILVIVRFRFHIVSASHSANSELRTANGILAEDLGVLAFSSSHQSGFSLLSKEEAERLMDAAPDANVPPDVAKKQIERVTSNFDLIQSYIVDSAWEKAEALLDAHKRVRAAAKLKGITYKVEPHLPPDVLGVYVYMPVI